MSRNRRASCAAASPRTPTTLDSLSPARWAARSVTSSLSRSAEGTIGRPTAHATSVRGGSRPASTRSRLPAGSGRRRTDAASSDPNDRRYPGRTALPRPLTQRQRVGTSAPCSRIVTMWRLNDPVEEDMSAPLGIDPHGKRRRSRRRAWLDGRADQTGVQTLEDVRSYRAFERALIANVDPRSVLELALAHRLASLLWRLRRASAIETGLFEIHSKLLIASRQDLSRGAGQRATLPSPAHTNGNSKALGSNGGADPPASDQKPQSASAHPQLGPSSNSCPLAQSFVRLFNLDPTFLDRAGAYETRLWRQAAQTIWTLDAMRRPPTAVARPRFRKPVARYAWDWDRRIGHCD